MVSVNMPQAIWSSHRIRSPRNYDSPADSRVSRVNAVNTLPDSIPLNSETYNDRRCPVTKEYPSKVPWSLIKRCTRLSTCSSEIIEQSVSPLAHVMFMFSCVCLGSFVFVLPLHIIRLFSSAILRSEIIERELGPNDARRRCAENVEWILHRVKPIFRSWMWMNINRWMWMNTSRKCE